MQLLDPSFASVTNLVAKTSWPKKVRIGLNFLNLWNEIFIESSLPIFGWENSFLRFDFLCSFEKYCQYEIVNKNHWANNQTHIFGYLFCLFLAFKHIWIFVWSFLGHVNICFYAFWNLYIFIYLLRQFLGIQIFFVYTFHCICPYLIQSISHNIQYHIVIFRFTSLITPIYKGPRSQWSIFKIFLT